MLRWHPYPLGHVLSWAHPRCRVGKLRIAPDTTPPPPQLPSFLPARHLVLVPSKRMRRGSLPLPVIKASLAQLTPKRPPLDTAASGKTLPIGWAEPWPPASVSPGFTFTPSSRIPFLNPGDGRARDGDLPTDSFQLAREEAGREVRDKEPESAEAADAGAQRAPSQMAEHTALGEAFPCLPSPPGCQAGPIGCREHLRPPRGSLGQHVPRAARLG